MLIWDVFVPPVMYGHNEMQDISACPFGAGKCLCYVSLAVVSRRLFILPAIPGLKMVKVSKTGMKWSFLPTICFTLKFQSEPANIMVVTT